MRLVCLAALLALVVAAVDEINQLPGVDWELNFKHYSGFFQVSPTHMLHYWFVESQNDPANDPLLFWFNGKCSKNEFSKSKGICLGGGSNPQCSTGVRASSHCAIWQCGRGFKMVFVLPIV